MPEIIKKGVIMCHLKKGMLMPGVLAVVTIAMGFAPILHAAPAPKVAICHFPPGNPGNAHDIRISENALPAHLLHGDFLGPCDSQPVPEVCAEGDTCVPLADVCAAGDCNGPIPPLPDTCSDVLLAGNPPVGPGVCVVEPPPDNGASIFVTSTTFNGDLGGISGADHKCFEAATAAGLPGTWHAWLSDASHDALLRFVPNFTCTALSSNCTSQEVGFTAVTPLVLPDGSTVANDILELVLNPLQHPINIDEFGNQVDVDAGGGGRSSNSLGPGPKQTG